MQLLRSSSEVGSDVRCPVCGQGFLLYWTRNTPGDQPVLVSVIMDALGRQHTAASQNPHEETPALRAPWQIAAPATLADMAEARWGYS